MRGPTFSSMMALLLAGCLHAPDEPLPVPEGFLAIGHRGAPKQAAENTLASFQEALRQGANAVEVDLNVTADQRVAVWHDADPDDAVSLIRQAGTEGYLYVPKPPPPGSACRRPVEELSLRTLLATHGYARGARYEIDPGAPIPTLEELAEWANGASGLKAVLLDIKQKRVGPAKIILAASLASFDPTRGYTVYLLCTSEAVRSALAKDLAAAGEPAGFLVLGDMMFGDALARAEQEGLQNVMVGDPVTRINHDFLAELAKVVSARDEGRVTSVMVGTINGRVDQYYLLQYGVNGICTDDPGELAELWKNPGPLQRRPEDYPVYAPWHRW
ncbi:MAG: hypothetical protein HY901_30800 [Deltaproteobacteria bacterium]|nr:hypothetical protein [Deltaproteobacteria bacterium]